MRRKVKRYNGEEDSVVEDFLADSERMAEDDALDEAKAEFQRRSAAKKSDTTEEFKRPFRSTDDAKSETAAAVTPKKTSFSSAFAEARAKALKGGPKTFEWNGKKYGTELAQPKSQAKTPVKPTGTSLDSSRAAKARSYEEARQTEAEQKRRMAAQTRAAGATDMGTLRKSTMDAYLPIDEQRIYSQFKKGGKVKSASARADGCCIRGKTRA